MSAKTYEATVENGQIRLPDGVLLPEHATVYVVVPTPTDARLPRAPGPRLLDRAELSRFELEVDEDPRHASL